MGRVAATVRTRFAPSPTGDLHIGSARTALFNWLFARKTGGRFVLRIEDTDIARSSRSFENTIMEDLLWLGLQWDEGPDKGGGFGPYRQSERLGIYRDYAERLVRDNRAYRCYCTKERLEELKERQIRAGVPPRYDGRCRGIKGPDIPAGVTPVIRFRVPEKTVSFVDGVHGSLSFDTKIFGDFVIIGSDGIAAYNFAVVIDDALMSITHIIRGDDHISNTPRQLLVFDALGFASPSYSHIPLVLSPDKAPLSKRDLSAALRGLKKEGFLGEAVINAIARLGWSPGDDFMGLDEMTRAFSVEKLSKSPSIFDIDKLKYYNKIAMEKIDSVSLLKLLTFTADNSEGLKDAVDSLKSNASTLKELKTLLEPFIGEAILSEEDRALLSEAGSKKVLKAFRGEAGKTEVFDEESYRRIIAAVKASTGEKGKRLFLPIRLALTGAHEGIELVNVLRLLGKKKVIERLERAEG